MRFLSIILGLCLSKAQDGHFSSSAMDKLKVVRNPNGSKEIQTITGYSAGSLIVTFAQDEVVSAIDCMNQHSTFFLSALPLVQEDPLDLLTACILDLTILSPSDRFDPLHILSKSASIEDLQALPLIQFAAQVTPPIIPPIQNIPDIRKTFGGSAVFDSIQSALDRVRRLHETLSPLVISANKLTLKDTLWAFTLVHKSAALGVLVYLPDSTGLITVKSNGNQHIHDNRIPGLIPILTLSGVINPDVDTASILVSSSSATHDSLPELGLISAVDSLPAASKISLPPPSPTTAGLHMLGLIPSSTTSTTVLMPIDQSSFLHSLQRKTFAQAGMPFVSPDLIAIHIPCSKKSTSASGRAAMVAELINLSRLLLLQHHPDITPNKRDSSDGNGAVSDSPIHNLQNICDGILISPTISSLPVGQHSLVHPSLQLNKAAVFNPSAVITYSLTSSILTASIPTILPGCSLESIPVTSEAFELFVLKQTRDSIYERYHTLDLKARMAIGGGLSDPEHSDGDIINLSLNKGAESIREAIGKSIKVEAECLNELVSDLNGLLTQKYNSTIKKSNTHTVPKAHHQLYQHSEELSGHHVQKEHPHTSDPKSLDEETHQLNPNNNQNSKDAIKRKPLTNKASALPDHLALPKLDSSLLDQIHGESPPPPPPHHPRRRGLSTKAKLTVLVIGALALFISFWLINKFAGDWNDKRMADERVTDDSLLDEGRSMAKKIANKFTSGGESTLPHVLRPRTMLPR